MPKRREIPWLEKRGDTYYVFWYSPETRVTEKLSLRTKNLAVAQDRYAAFLTEGKDLFNAKGPAGLSVSKALDDYYFEHVRKHCVSTINIEISIRHLKTYFKDRPIKEIGVPECTAYTDYRMSGQDSVAVKAVTAGKEISVLRAAAWHANKWKRLSLADMPTFEIPKGAASKGVWLFEDELMRLRQAAATIKDELLPLRTLSFIELCYYTASRKEAIETLTWPQIDIARRRLALAKHGEKKTNKRRPTIAITPAWLPVIKRLEQQRINMWVLGDDGRMGYWFLLAAQIAGLEYLPERDGRPTAHITPHMLRHSRATHLLQAGVDPWQVANLLGDSLATVLRVYGHFVASTTENIDDPRNGPGSISASGGIDLSDIVK